MIGPRVAGLAGLAGVDRGRVAGAAGLAIGALSLPAVLAYPGAGWRGLAFCLVSGGLVPLVIAIGHSPFRLLIGAFLALGFWAKFVAHFAIGAELVEPMGAFPATPAAWDAALGFATAGLAGVSLAILCSWRLHPGDTGARPRPAGPPDARARRGLALLAFSAAPALVVFVFNHQFAILRVGFVPMLDLHPYLYVAIAFPVTWGVLLWTLALAWWLVEQGGLPPKALAHLAAIEGAAAALSMGSRAQMLLHVGAAGLALWHGLRWRGWHLPRRDWIEIGAVFVPLLATTLLLVSIDRAIAYPGALVSVPPDSASARKTAGADSVREIPKQLRHLVVLRWVGLEGVMATVASEEPLGLPLLHRAMVEQPSAGVDALYQRMARSVYPRSDQFVFLTIPGPVAFAAFSGSALVCFLLMAALVGTGTLLEHLAGRVTANPAVAAVTGVALAYLVAQLNFPRTLFFFVLELIAATLVLAAVGPLLRAPGAREQPATRDGHQ